MTSDEMLVKMRSILGDVQCKEYGLYKKYEKQLTSRKVADNTILGVSKYTIEGNLVYVVCSKQLFGRGKRDAEIVFTEYIGCLNPNDGKLSFLRPNWDLDGVRLIGFSYFTAHCIKRLKERAGEEFVDFLKKYGSKPMSFIKKNGEDNFEAKFYNCPHKFFGYDHGTCQYITTMVTEEMCFENQLETADELEGFAEEYWNYKCKKLSA